MNSISNTEIMSSLKINILSCAVSAAFLLSGCAADAPESEVITSGDQPFWLTFELSQTTDGIEPHKAPSTRADVDLNKNVNESKVTSLIALLVDTDNQGNATYVRGVSQAKSTDIKSSDDKKTHTVILNMGLSTLYARQHKYRLYVFANLTSSDYDAIKKMVGRDIYDVGQRVAHLSPFTPEKLAESSSTGLPLGTENENAKTIQVYLKENVEYTYESPYVAQIDPDDSEDGTPGKLSLTPLCSRLDFVEDTKYPNFTYPIQYTVETDKGTETKTEVEVTFKQAKVVNASGRTYLIPAFQKNSTTVRISPELTITSTSNSLAVSEGAAVYVPEFVPTIADNSNNLSYEGTTYMEVTGTLSASNSNEIDPLVKNAITGATHPTLYYYDDGKFQSALTTTPHAGETHWYAVNYDTALGGYAVTYRHAIRHDAGDGKNEDDGVVYPMEYGIVRNYIYQIGIKSVSALPHPQKPGDPVESGKQDISIRINPPAKWTYHRGGFEISFE
ncbi:MAG: fimbria major subunit [Bacteroidales bacterium]|nr:fimbria major subunit [Bacteroidales bacterium]